MLETTHEIEPVVDHPRIGERDSPRSPWQIAFLLLFRIARAGPVAQSIVRCLEVESRMSLRHVKQSVLLDEASAVRIDDYLFDWILLAGFAAAAQIDRIRRRGRSGETRLVAMNRFLVDSVAREYVGWRFDRQRLVRVGTDALLHAAAEFDPRNGLEFGDYAAGCIRKAMARAVAVDDPAAPADALANAAGDIVVILRRRRSLLRELRRADGRRARPSRGVVGRADSGCSRFPHRSRRARRRHEAAGGADSERHDAGYDMLTRATRPRALPAAERPAARYPIAQPPVNLEFISFHP